MKKILFSLAACSALFACQKNMDQPNVNLGNEPGTKCELTVGISGAATKATEVTQDNEEKVNNLQIFVFRGNELDAYGTKDNVLELTISCTAGEREVYAAVNAPDLSAINSKADLLATVSELSNNHLDSFEMFGSKQVSLPSQSTVSIDVERIASRIVVKEIERAFTSAGLQTLDFKIDAIYVINVANSRSYDFNAINTDWYNEHLYEDELAELTHDAVAQKIAQGNKYETAHSFYVYPHAADVETTRLVIETTLGTKKYYYPINMPALERNKSYEVDLVKITRPGSDDPNVPVSFADATFEVNVIDWTVVPVTEGTII